MNTCLIVLHPLHIPQGHNILTHQHDQLSMESHYRHIIDTFDLHHLDSAAELAVTPRVARAPES